MFSIQFSLQLQLSFIEVLSYDIDVFDDCKSVQIYKCSNDNRVLFQKLGPNQYQPLPKDPRMTTLTYIYSGIPTKFKNGLYTIPHQDIQPMFIPFSKQYSSSNYKNIAIIQSHTIQLDFTNNILKVGQYQSTFEYTNLTDILLVKFELFNYDFNLIYKLNVSLYIPIQTNVKYNKQQLVYLSQTALLRDISLISILVDIIIEVVQVVLIYIWNFIKHKYLSKQIIHEINKVNLDKKQQIQQEKEEYKRFKEGLKTEMEKQLENIIHRDDVVQNCSNQQNTNKQHTNKECISKECISKQLINKQCTNKQHICHETGICKKQQIGMNVVKIE